MKAAVVEAPMKVVVKEVPRPEAEAGTVLVKVRKFAICGSDLAIFKGTHPRTKPPIILGHEFVGEVASGSSASSAWKSGQRVTANPLIGSCGHCPYCLRGNIHLCNKLVTLGINCPGAYAEFVNVPARNLLAVPDEVADEEGSLVEPLAVAVSAVRHGRIQLGDAVGVLGSGPIGLLTIGALKAAGASAIAATDARSRCLELAPVMGASKAFDAKGPWVDGIRNSFGPLDVTFVAASGSPEVAAEIVAGAIELTRKEGTIFVLSNLSSKIAVDVTKLRRNHQVMTGSTSYSSQDFALALELIRSKTVNARAIVSHQFPLEAVEKGFDALLHDATSIKVLIEMPHR